MIRRILDRTASRLRYLLVPTFTAMLAPAWAVLPPSEQFAAEPGVQARVSTRTTLPNGTRRVEGHVPGYKTYRIEADCTRGTVAMYRLEEGQWDLRYAARRRGEGWERSTIDGPVARIPAGSNLDWLATAQFDSVCTPKVRTDVLHVPQE
ncbi:hypothetical protein [Stenotrophomonas rhizophila]|uniref:hypothetical protein n=1 Tax=Stenotrophomonas rhizophila TaxID=216778 RepID=UPI00112F683C|nr:hypothetical protein [Stenotrophomonas rhizophila]